MYRYQGEQVSDRLIYIDDHHWDEHSQSFPVQALLTHSSRDHVLIFDHLGHDDVLQTYPHCVLPVYLSAEVQQFCQANIVPNWSSRDSCFNFMINKPRHNRYAVMKFVHQHKLVSRRHSLAWQHSPFDSIDVTDWRLGSEIQLDKGIKNGHYTNAETYRDLLKHSVFEPSCVSLITEPCWQEREIMITEKTVMAMWAGTIPIWVGGWRLPDALRELGFDVFDDIVDHSYSTLPDPEQRIYQAMQKNIGLLHDFDAVHDIVNRNHDRLLHNLDLLQSNVFLQLVHRQIQSWPDLAEIADLWGLPVSHDHKTALTQ